MKKAKEKAKELVDKFYSINDSEEENNTGTNPYISREYAKKCAIIHIDEVVKLEALTDEAWLNVPDEYKVQHWKEVKEEIIKL
jgi:hypothetical protein